MLNTIEAQQTRNVAPKESDSVPEHDIMIKGNNVIANKIKINCEICQKKFKNTYNLEAHINKLHTTNAKLHKCDYCSSTFEENSELSAHISERHITCKYCRKLFTAPKLLESHIQAIHKKNIESVHVT